MNQEAALKYTKQTLVLFLKAFLRNYDNYRGFCERDFSETAIFVEEPLELRTWPMVVVTGSTGQIVTAGLSDLAGELYDENGQVTGYRYSGIYNFNIQVDIATRSTVDRDRMVDLISFTYRHLLRRYMEARGVLVVTMNYGGQSDMSYNSDKIYFATVNFTTWSEWKDDVQFISSNGVDFEMK